MDRSLIRAVIMAGGWGERFWPFSTPDRPKQYLDLTGDGTLIQRTFSRLRRRLPSDQIYVVTAERNQELARTQLPELPGQNLLIEPVRRNTAPCIGLAAVWLERVDRDALMLVVPADHYIPDEERFWQAAELALEHAQRSQGLVTLGIQPNRAETGYGYIEVGTPCQEAPEVFSVSRFVEKPDQRTAEIFLSSGRFLWNAGIFAWSVRTIREEIAHHLPDLHAGLEALAATSTFEELAWCLPDAFPRLSSISIDYGIMERSNRVSVVPARFRWDDLGSWNAVARLFPADKAGNVIRGKVILEDCSDMLVESDGRLVAAMGVNDLIIVVTGEAVLVCPRNRAQEVRKLAARVRE